MEIIVSRHAINRYRDRCVKIPIDKTRKILKDVVLNNTLIPYFNLGVMYCKSQVDDIVLILTTSDAGDIVVKTVMTIHQFNQQQNRLEKTANEKSNTTDINILTALGSYSGDISVNTHVKLGE